MDTGEELSMEVSPSQMGHDEPFSETVAARLLCSYVYEYEEIADQIKTWVGGLVARGVSASEAEVELRREIEVVEPRLLAAREERMRQIHDPRTRAGVVPQREVERQLLATYGDGAERVARARQQLAEVFGNESLGDGAVRGAVTAAEEVAKAAGLDADALFRAAEAEEGRAGDGKSEKKNFEMLPGWLRKFGRR
jgi:hypothetical protein